ncbi:hypothetical protein [Deinococcus sp.]|uniref:TapB family protein n=1 Tax=Deinococcus sp. TaxID=47478 RepID=UPI003CC5D5AA
MFNRPKLSAPKSCAVLALLALVSGAAQAACDTLAFFPPVTNTYAMTGSGASSTITVATTVSGNAATSLTTLNGKTTKVVWTCTDKGLSATLDGGMQMSTGFLPPLSAWRVGYRWSSHSQVAGGSGINASSSSQNRIAALEKVTTPAGTFSAYRVETDVTTHLELPAGTKLPPSMAKSLNTAMHSVAWYAVGVGAVKQQMQGGKVTMLLVKTTK